MPNAETRRSFPRIIPFMDTVAGTAQIGQALLGRRGAMAVQFVHEYLREM
jgi:hypothetical protein